MAAGDFSCAQLVKVTRRADTYWADSMLNADFAVETAAIDAIRAEQTARLVELQDPSKDRKVGLIWLNDCDTTVNDCTNDCVVDGPELEAGCKEYDLTQCKSVGFSVKEKMFRASEFDFEEVVARGFLTRTRLLDEQIAKSVVPFLEAHEGTNSYAPTGWTINGTETDIPTADWSGNLFPRLQLAATYNRFNNPFLLSGENLYLDALEAEHAQCCDNKEKKSKLNTIRKYFDLWNIDPTNAPDYKTYMVNRGAVAFVSKAYHPRVPMEYNGAGIAKFKIASRNLPGVEYDVVYKNECVNNEIIHKWTIYAHFDLLLSPVGCDANKTGILTFKRA